MKKRRCKSHSKTFHWLTPMLNNLKYGYSFILTERDEVLNQNLKILIIYGSSQENVGQASNLNTSLLVKLYFLCYLQQTKPLSVYTWGKTKQRC